MAEDDEKVIEVDYSVTSLGEPGVRTKSDVLKAELSDFAKLKPETVAAIIKEMFRKDQK